MMKVKDQYCFSIGDEVIRLFTLSNRIGTEIKISNYGAIITSFTVRMADGAVNDIVLGFDHVEEYRNAAYLANYPWFGAAIGRYANRIKNGIIEIDGTTHQLALNDGHNQLHGGLEGFDKKVWHVHASGTDPFEWMELKYISRDGEQGFPGNLEIFVRFELTDENELIYTYRATTDQPTAINLTHHDYFNLHTHKNSIAGHKIKIYSAFTLDQDNDLTATGTVSKVDDTLFDFREFRSIENARDSAWFDKSFVVAAPGAGIVAEARSPESGLMLQVLSTDPVVHFYTGQWIPHIPGKNNAVYVPGSGFCFETQFHPNAINIPSFPSTILRPGEVWTQQTVYRVRNS